MLWVYISQFWLYNTQLQIITSKLWDVNSQLRVRNSLFWEINLILRYKLAILFSSLYLAILTLQHAIANYNIRIARYKLLLVIKSECCDINSKLQVLKDNCDFLISKFFLVFSELQDIYSQLQVIKSELQNINLQLREIVRIVSLYLRMSFISQNGEFLVILNLTFFFHGGNKLPKK